MVECRLDPRMSKVFGRPNILLAHLMMLRDEHKSGNIAVLGQAPRAGRRTFEDALLAEI